MKKLPFFICFLLMVGQAWAQTTYYVDKRTGSNDYTTVQAQDPATPWATIDKAMSSGGIAAFTVEVVEGSGPYLRTDFPIAAGGNIYVTNNNNLITINLNGNTVNIALNANDGTYEWHQSTAVGKTTWYYLTAVGGIDPSLTQVKSCVVNGNWSAESTNLVSGYQHYGRYLSDNWGWGDFDTLGFNTLYVKLSTEDSPANYPSMEIWAAQKSKVVDGGAFGPVVINNGTLAGANAEIVIAQRRFTLNNVTLYNADQQGVSVNGIAGSGSTAKFCRFIDCGHRGIRISVQADVNLFNNHFENIHMMAFLDSNTAYTATIRNNSSKNLLAYAIQHDELSPTLVESNNQFHIDPDTTHGGAALAVAATRWLVTDATDIPASTDTTLACIGLGNCGTDPLINTDGTLQSGSPAIRSGTRGDAVSLVGTQEDYFGNEYFFAPYDRLNIGADQRYSDADLRPTAGGILWRMGTR